MSGMFYEKLEEVIDLLNDTFNIWAEFLEGDSS